jgi:hypothetical protein
VQLLRQKCAAESQGLSEKQEQAELPLQ